MALLYRCGNCHWMGSLDSECVYLQITLDCKKKTSTYPNRQERPLIRKTGWGATERCWNYRRKVLPSELTNTYHWTVAYVHRNETHFTYMWIHHTNVFEVDSNYKNTPPNVISPKQNCYFFSLWGSTHDSAADYWRAHRPRPRQLQTCSQLMQGWVASAGWCPPPNKNPGYAVALCSCIVWELSYRKHRGSTGIIENTLMILILNLSRWLCCHSTPYPVLSMLSLHVPPRRWCHVQNIYRNIMITTTTVSNGWSYTGTLVGPILPFCGSVISMQWSNGSKVLILLHTALTMSTIVSAPCWTNSAGALSSTVGHFFPNLVFFCKALDCHCSFIQLCLPTCIYISSGVTHV